MTVNDFMKSDFKDNFKESPIRAKRKIRKSYDSSRGDELPESSSSLESKS